MSAIDFSSATSVNRIIAKVNSNIRIRCDARDHYLMGCYNIDPSTKAIRSKKPHIGSLKMNEVTSEKQDVDVQHYSVGATYLTKQEYNTTVCFSGRDLRYSEKDIVSPVSDRMMEADDNLMDNVMIDSLLGPMMVGDQCRPHLVKDICCIEHEDTGITPDKISAAATAIRRFCPNHEVIIPITPDIHRQLTQFDAFTNNDFLLPGQKSANHGMVLDSKWYNVKFKMVPDFVEGDGEDGQTDLVATIPAERYIDANGDWDGETYVRYLPVWSKMSLDFEEYMRPEMTMYDVWKQRRKPKGTMEARIDHEFGFAMNNPRGRAVLKVLETNKDLCV